MKKTSMLLFFALINIGQVAVAFQLDQASEELKKCRRAEFCNYSQTDDMASSPSRAFIGMGSLSMMLTALLCKMHDKEKTGVQAFVPIATGILIGAISAAKTDSKQVTYEKYVEKVKCEIEKNNDLKTVGDLKMAAGDLCKKSATLERIFDHNSKLSSDFGDVKSAVDRRLDNYLEVLAARKALSKQEIDKFSANEMDKLR